MKSSKSDEAADSLYAVPPGAFVAERNKLADDLRKEGDAAAAKAVKALAKPNFSAWVTNQTVRRAPALVERLLKVTDALADAQRGTGGKRGEGKSAEPQRLQTAIAEQRQVMGELAAVAEKVLNEAGQGSNRGALDQVRNHLRFAPVSPEARSSFESGRLVRDTTAPGFAALVAPQAGAHGDGDDGGDADGDVTATKGSRSKRRAAGATQATPKSGRSGGPDGRDAGTHEHQKKQAHQADAAKTREAIKARREAGRRLASLQVDLRRARADVTRARQDLDRAEKARKTKADRIRAVESELAVARLAVDAAEAARKAAADTLSAREKAAADLERRISAEEKHSSGTG